MAVIVGKLYFVMPQMPDSVQDHVLEVWLQVGASTCCTPGSDLSMALARRSSWCCGLVQIEQVACSALGARAQAAAGLLHAHTVGFLAGSAQ